MAKFQANLEAYQAWLNGLSPAVLAKETVYEAAVRGTVPVEWAARVLLALESTHEADGAASGSVQG